MVRLSDRPDLLSSGFTWPESPRWWDGALWISDVHNFRLVRVAPDGTSQTVGRFDGRPSGMHIGENGNLVLATALDRKLLVFDHPTATIRDELDLASLCRAHLNDLIVSADGWTWVGDTGFVFGRDPPAPVGSIIAYHPQTGARIVCHDVNFPNGMAIAPDRSTLYVAETFGKCISAFSIDDGGSLTARRVHAPVAGAPDGICIDSEGCLWVSLLFEGAFVRLSAEGRVLERIAFPGQHAIACMLGGDDGLTLFLCVASVDKSVPEKPIRVGAIYATRAPAPALQAGR